MNVTFIIIVINLRIISIIIIKKCNSRDSPSSLVQAPQTSDSPSSLVQASRRRRGSDAPLRAAGCPVGGSRTPMLPKE